MYGLVQSPYIRSMYMRSETRCYCATQVVVYMDSDAPTPCGRNKGVITHLDETNEGDVESYHVYDTSWYWSG